MTDRYEGGIGDQMSYQLHFAPYVHVYHRLNVPTILQAQ